MSHHPTEQELFTLRGLADLAQSPHADAQQILQHLQTNMQAMNQLQQEFGALQASVQEQSQAQVGSTPITSLSAAIETLTAAHLEHQQMQQNYQQSLQQVLAGLSQRSSSGRATVPPPLNPKFKGSDGQLSFAEFSSKLITMQSRFPEAFSTDVDKVNYALQSLEGIPALYFAPYVNGLARDDEQMLTNYTIFMRVLDEMYGDQHNADEINHLLTRLRQSGSMTEYIAKFRSLSARSGWNDVSLLSRFKEGLSDDIKSMLTPQWHTLSTLRLAQSAAISAYQNSQARIRHNKASSRTQAAFPNWQRRSHASPAAAASTPSPSAMDLDMVRTKHITADEKQRRRDGGLCLYCGGANHFAGSCPVKKARLAAVTINSDSENDLA